MNTHPSLSVVQITRHIVQACSEVHRALGPGLPSTAYLQALEVELGVRGLQVRHDVEYPLLYKGRKLDSRIHWPMVVEGLVAMHVAGPGATPQSIQTTTHSLLRHSYLARAVVADFDAESIRSGLFVVSGEGSPIPHRPPLPSPVVSDDCTVEMPMSQVRGEGDEVDASLTVETPVVDVDRLLAAYGSAEMAPTSEYPAVRRARQ